jgi:hypothetical protein
MIYGPVAISQRQARVWIDEVPHQLQAADTLIASLPCDHREGSRVGEDRILAIELRIDITPRHEYALLGGIFRPEASGKFRASIPITDKKEMEFADSLVRPIDHVYWELPKEYGKAVHTAIMRHGRAPCGSLEITSAACGEIGSSQVIFACLSQVLLGALEQNMSPEQIAAMALKSNVSNVAAMLRS